MKKIFAFAMIIMTLTACTGFQVQPHDLASTAIPTLTAEAITDGSGGGPGENGGTVENGSGGYIPSGTTEEIKD